MGEMKRILIVEDSPTVIEMMKLMLRDMNVKVQTAGSEFGMFQSIESFGKIVDLIIMDITLKSENGLDLIERLRENPKYQTLPVIVVTEHAKTDFILRAKNLSVKSFIRKPIEKQIFIERLVEAIGIEPLSTVRPAGSSSEPETKNENSAPADENQIASQAEPSSTVDLNAELQNSDPVNQGLPDSE